LQRNFERKKKIILLIGKHYIKVMPTTGKGDVLFFQESDAIYVENSLLKYLFRRIILGID